MVKRKIRHLINLQIKNIKCAKCKFRNKVRKEWCYMYDRRIVEIFDQCTIDPKNISQDQIKLLNKRKLKNHSAS